MDWFERLTGFREDDVASPGSRLEVLGDALVSRVNGKRFGIGRFEMASLADLRQRAGGGQPKGRLQVSNVTGDVRALHRDPAHRGALFQVASQFNMLEMIHSGVTPEDGVTRYQHDGTQGPACAMAAGAATIYRNYFVPVGDQIGQTADRQLDGAAELRTAIAADLGVEPGALWSMQNGYLLPTRAGLSLVKEYLQGVDAARQEALQGLLRIGLHWDVQTTEAEAPDQFVSQAFCSAVPVAYTGLPASDWAPLAKLVLEAAYEATFAAAAINAAQGRSNTLFLTRLGGGAFGNDAGWIDDAMAGACAKFRHHDLGVRIVNFGAAPRAMEELARRYPGGVD